MQIPSYLSNGELSDDGQLPIDFKLTVIEKKITHNMSDKKEQVSYLVEASFTDGRPNIQKWIQDIRTIDLFNDFEINDCFILPNMKKLLVSKLMNEVPRVPCRTINDSDLGIQDIIGSKAYIMGEHVLWKDDEPENIEVKTHYKLLCNKNYDGKELLEQCASYINLLPEVSEILFYGSLFAIVKPFLAQLNISCGFVLALVAPSGYLKTTLVRLYALWLDMSEEQEMGFDSPQRDSHILEKIEHLQGQNFLLDDICKKEDANKSRRQENRLDIVSRHVSRKKNCANVIITGEPVEKMGIFSCMDRLFQVRMPKMNALQIEELKKKVSLLEKGIMPNIALVFVKSLMSNYEAVIHDIQSFYDQKSINKTVATGYATRTYIHAMYIRMTKYLFGKYVCNPELYLIKDNLPSAIDKQIQSQEVELQKIRSQEEHDYIAELYDILQAEGKYIKVVDKNTYTNFETSCVLTEKQICITSAALKNALFNYYQEYINPKLVIDALHNNGILEEEPGSRGRQKNCQGIKHYVINRRMFVNYLYRNNYSIPDSEVKKFISNQK